MPPAVRYCLIAVWVVGVIVITGGLIYFPALALPIFGVVGHDEEVVRAIELRPLPVLELTSLARAFDVPLLFTKSVMPGQVAVTARNGDGGALE